MKVNICVAEYDNVKEWLIYADDDFRIAISDARCEEVGYIEVEQETINRMIAEKQRRNKRDEDLARCARLNNLGIAFEKEGKIAEAINAYERNIVNPYPAHHSFNRLAILYRKQKDYLNELRVIEKAISTFQQKRRSIREPYLKRLIKCQELIAEGKKHF